MRGPQRDNGFVKAVIEILNTYLYLRGPQRNTGFFKAVVIENLITFNKIVMYVCIYVCLFLYNSRNCWSMLIQLFY